MAYVYVCVCVCVYVYVCVCAPTKHILHVSNMRCNDRIAQAVLEGRGQDCGRVAEHGA